jgi:hypothetical protein
MRKEMREKRRRKRKREIKKGSLRMTSREGRDTGLKLKKEGKSRNMRLKIGSD